MATVDWEQCPVGSRVEAKLEAIHTAVKKTNGDVNLLKKFMWVSIGAIGILGILFGSMKMSDFMKLLGG